MTASPFDHHAIRAQFPTLNQVLDEHSLCYLDSAATSQKPQMVLDAMAHYYQFDNANVHRAAHQLSARATVHYEHVRDQIQTFIKAQKRQEIIFTQGTTASINMVAHGVTHLFNQDDVILVDSAAHHANIVPWQALAQRTGAKVIPIGLDKFGHLDEFDFNDKLKLNPKLVALSHISNALGSVNDVKTLVAYAQDRGAMVLIDGAQAVAHIEVDVSDINCDFYVFSGHKMYAPTGIGVLYGKEDKLNMLTPMLTGGEMIKTVSFDGTTYGELPNRLEAGTPPIAEVIGLGAAVSFLQSFDRSQAKSHEQQLMSYLQQQLSELGDITLYGVHPDKLNVGSVAFNLGNEHHQDVGILLDQQGVAVRCGHHCAMPLMQALNLKGCCRASIGIYTTKADIDQFIAALTQVKDLLL